MPVSVSLPTRIRVDRAALVDHPEWVDDAVRSALGRALANSRKVVLDPRAGVYGIRLGEPVFQWSGLAISHAERVRFERRLRALIAQAIADEGIGADPPPSDVAPVMPDDPSEPFDPGRGSRLLERYLLDSYEGGTAEVHVTGANPPRLFDYFEEVSVFSDPLDPEAVAAFDALIENASVDAPRGIIFRLDTPGAGTGWQVVISTGGEGYAAAFTFPAFTAFRFQGENADPLFKPVPYVPAVGKASAELFDLPGSLEARRDLYKNLFGELLGNVIHEQYPQPVTLTKARYKQLIDDKIAAGIEQGLRNIGPNIVKAIRVKFGRATTILWMTADAAAGLNWTKEAALEVLTHDVIQVRGKKKKDGALGASSSDRTGRVKHTGSGSSRCPTDTVPEDQWGGFMNEPAVGEIGERGLAFQQAIARIAGRIGMPEGTHAGQFCIDAANALSDLAKATGSMDEPTIGENRPADGRGNLGAIDFKAGGSPVIARIRDLAAIVSDLSEFIEFIRDTFHEADYGCTIHGMYRGNGVGWVLHFLEEVVDPMRWVVYHLFVGGCRSTLIQLLRTSASEIEKRQAAMDRYAPLFEKWMLPQIRGLAEIENLERRLAIWEMDQVNHPLDALQRQAASTATGQAWIAKTDAFVAALAGPAVSHSAGTAYEVVQEGGLNKVRDLKGVLWSRNDLQQARAIQRNVVEGIDPLVKQIQDTSEAMDKFKAADSVRPVLESLLDEMLQDNYEMDYRSYSDAMYAFGATQRSEDIPHATVPLSKYALTGVHKLTHQQIGDAFGGSRFYPEGIDFLFDSEEGKASLEGFGVMVGMVALAVLVPGGAFLAFAAGAGLAAHELDKAYEKKRLYRALIDPDLVLSYAEVEIGIFVAWFGVVLAALPEVGTATKGLIEGGRAIIKGEVRALGVTAGRAIARSAAKTLVEYAAKDLLQAFVKELVLNIVIGEIIQQVMGKVVEQMQAGADAPSGAPAAAGPAPLDAQGQAFIRMIRARGAGR